MGACRIAESVSIASLKNHGVDAEAQALLEVGRKALSLPLEEKLKYELGDEGGSFGCVIAVHVTQFMVSLV